MSQEQSELENDLLCLPCNGAKPEGLLSEKSLRASVSFADDDGDCECGPDDEEDEIGGFEEEDPLAEGEGEDRDNAADEEEDDGFETEVATEAEGAAPDAPKKSKKKSSKSLGARLAELAKPREARPDAPLDDAKPVKRVEKKPQKSRPSLLLRLKPTNLEESREAFFASGFTVAPRFTYALDEEEVRKAFDANSNVCFELLPEANRILEKVHEEHGGPELFMQKLFGEEKIQAEELQEIVAEYLKDHNIDDKVEIRIVDNMLAAANVVKPSADEKYRVNLANGPISKNMVQGICDHEVGTHLLRMMNDEHQVWHGRRDRYKMINPWTTEEGFATLNTYISMPCKLLYSQALRYFSVCRGAELGFVELFSEINQHVSDPKRTWQMCCRIKRGMTDTSEPGAFYMDQAYFKGAVEILRHLDEVDFGRLYGGQVALQDLDKTHFLLRKDCVRLPRFLNSAEKLKTYKAHCRKLIKENEIDTALERVCHKMHVRSSGKEFFKEKKKSAFATAAPVTLGEKDGSTIAGQTIDLGRLQELSRPRQLVEPGSESEATSKGRDIDYARLANLSVPRCARTDTEDDAVGDDSAPSRAPNFGRLLDLARPRQMATIESGGTNATGSKAPNRARMLELSVPKWGSQSDAEGFDPSSGSTLGRLRGGSAPADRRRSRRSANVDEGAGEDGSGSERDDTTPASRPVDMARLLTLSQPRKKTDDEPVNVDPPKAKRKKGGRKRRKSKLRLLAMVQQRDEQQDGLASSPRDDADDESNDDEVDAPEEAASDLRGAVADAAEEADQEACEEEKKVSTGQNVHFDVARPPLPRRRSESRSEISVKLDESARSEFSRESRPVEIPRNVERSRSLGARSPPGTALGTLMNGGGTSSPGRPPRPELKGLSALNDLSMIASVEGHARRTRTSTSLPRPSKVLPRAAAAAIGGTVTTDANASLWKAVPIKTMSLQLEL